MMAAFDRSSFIACMAVSRATITSLNQNYETVDGRVRTLIGTGMVQPEVDGRRGHRPSASAGPLSVLRDTEHLPEIRPARAKLIELNPIILQRLFDSRKPDSRVVHACLLQQLLEFGALSFELFDCFVAFAEAVLLGTFFGI